MPTGLPPISRTDATILVLGTMPGKESPRAGEYYAHPRNAFWKMMAELLHFELSSPYAARVSSLIASKIALWDVLKLCTRESSLDSDIEAPVSNEFNEFFRLHPRIDRVCFNGAAAENLYNRHVRHGSTTSFEYRPLPSTSPANAAISYADKLAAWKAALIRP